MSMDRDRDREPRGDRDRDRDGGREGRDGGRMGFRRRRYCKFCEDKVVYIDYKDPEMLAGYVPERAKLAPRRISGTCAMHQRKLQTAVKQARNIALLPFTTE